MPRVRAASEIIKIRALYSRKDALIQTGCSTAVAWSWKTASLVRSATVEPSWYDDSCAQYLTSCTDFRPSFAKYLTSFTDFRPSFAKFTKVFHNCGSGSSGVGTYPAINGSFIA